ncbi:MAG: hypothetical protein JWQ96_896 [Segetibacter sp.]|nr:hypothetical protein [Segetibacter sp.]
MLFITYFYSIKPSQDILKNFEPKVEKRLDEYFFEKREKDLITAVENLSTADIQSKNNSLLFLSLTQHQGFSDLQLFKIYQVLRNGNLDKSQKLQLSVLSTTRVNQFATDYCKSILEEHIMDEIWVAGAYGTNSNQGNEYEKLFLFGRVCHQQPRN